MNKAFYLIFCLLLLSRYIVAQTTPASFTQTIKGLVTDKETRLPIPGVTIKLLSADPVKITSTDTAGRFRITGVPIGRHTVCMISTGFNTLALTEQLISSGKETDISVEMEPQHTALNEVVIRSATGSNPLNQMALNSGRSFSPEETNRYAGAFFDPARMAQSFAGVVAGGDNNEITAETFRLDEEIIDQTKVNTLTADRYIRVDFSASYRINGKKLTHLLLLDIQNLLNKENDMGLYYNRSKRIIEKEKWIGIIPTINYRIEI
jgi:hypothetical protein